MATRPSYSKVAKNDKNFRLKMWILCEDFGTLLPPIYDQVCMLKNTNLKKNGAQKLSDV